MFLGRIKPIEIELEEVAECEIIPRKPGRCVLRIYYKKMDEFKHYAFETDPDKAEKIFLKVHNILQCLFTSAPEEFLIARSKGRFR